MDHLYGIWTEHNITHIYRILVIPTWTMIWMNACMKIYKWHWTIFTQKNVCSQRQVLPQAKNTITLGQHNLKKLTPKTQIGTIGIHNATYILHERFGKNCTYIITILQEHTQARTYSHTHTRMHTHTHTHTHTPHQYHHQSKKRWDHQHLLGSCLHTFCQVTFTIFFVFF